MARLNQLSAAEAARAIESGSASAEALAAACLERIAERDREVQAWAYVARDRALEQARALDRTPRRSRLHGVPIGIKDVIDTGDQPTAYGSPIYRGHQPKADAAAVALLRHAGCLILGKTHTTEFANNHPAPTRNPHNVAHTPGGSSSGSAAAVADFMVPLALGTQTGGSVIRPAAFCGVFACKPSFGAINRAGLKFDAESLDTIGVFGRTVEDLALALEPLTGRPVPRFDAMDHRPRVGLCRTPCWKDADAATQANLEAAARALSRAGARVHNFELPPGSDQLFDRHKVIMGYENARALAWEYYNFPEKLSADLKPRLDEGWQFPRAEYDAMRAHASRCRSALADAMREVDFLLTPSAPGEAPASLATTGNPVFNRAWTLFGVPCVTIPHGAGAKGLPLGVQLVGAYDGDAALLGWAYWAARTLS
ncbi:MAG TPA: amidase [Burkholderiales bacterium]|jgi:Asp-tRNA(Asn)/Glu-tRNA(Gln) amidotransferase A subunit family amidase|nr:amidase [Burkholderiales bacterium]